MAPTKTIYIPAAKRDLDKHGRVKDKLIDLCRVGAQKDRVRVVITKPRASRFGGQDEQLPVLEVTPDGVVSEFGAPTMRQTLADAFPAEWRTAINDRRRERTAKKTARRARFARKKQGVENFTTKVTK